MTVSHTQRCRRGAFRRTLRALTLRGAALGSAALLTGCHQDMYDQVKYEPLEKSTFFEDGRSSRPLEPGVVPQGAVADSPAVATGQENGTFVAEIPLKVDAALLARGQERFQIFCTPCHGQAGYGDGMVVQRGFRAPPSYHIDRLRGVPDGRIFDTITNGFGTMPSLRERISVRDRWAIVSYVRALQFSQFATVNDLTPEDKTELDANTPNAPVKGGEK
jgi:mono/diheme cytochrome c family protein